jgi:hypothetical protein
VALPSTPHTAQCSERRRAKQEVDGISPERLLEILKEIMVNRFARETDKKERKRVRILIKSSLMNGVEGI